MTTIRLDAHKPEFHRAAPPQLPVRVATTANITISTALNVGDTIDGVTLIDGDRVLVKNQSTGLQNGVYIAGAVPARAFDMLEGVAAYGAIIYVVAGTANGGKQFVNTNTTVPTIDTDALTFADYTPGGSSAPTTADYLVGTAQAGLSAEIVVGTTPNGELGGTWGAITVDSTHSGSAHTDFIAKSVLTTQDDIIVRDGTGPARLAKGTDGQVLTVDPTTHHLVWATPTAGGISGIDVKEGGSPVVTAATILDFGNGLDVSSPGSGVAGVVVDPLEIKLDDLGTPDDNTDLDATTGRHGLLKKLGGGTTNFLRADGTWADPSVPSGSAFNEAVYGNGSDGNATIAAGTTSLAADKYYNDLTVTGTLDTNGYRVWVKGTVSGSGVISNQASLNGGNGGNGTGAVGGAAGSAGGTTSAHTLPASSNGTAGRIGGFNAAGGNGLAGQKATMARSDGTTIDQPAGTSGGAGANAGGSGGAGATGDNTLTPKPAAYPNNVVFKTEAGATYNMDSMQGKAYTGGAGGGSATGGGGGSGGGGGGGGVVVLVAKTWTGTFTVEAKGGNGGNGGNGFASSGSNGGGAGGNGGPGGVIVAIYADRTGWSGSLNVNGGTKGNGGTGNGGGSNGSNGNDGPAGIKMEMRVS